MELLNNQYVQIALIILAAVISARIVKLVILTMLKKFTAQTETDLDDLIIQSMSKPLYIGVLLIGVHYSILRFGPLNGYVPIVNNIFFVIYAIVISSGLGRVAAVLINHWLKVKRQFEKTPKLISRLASLTVYLIAGLIVLSHLQIEITPILGALGIGALAISLSLKDTLANFFAGIHIISDEPVRVGDFVEVNGHKGTVRDIGWRSTKLKTLGGNIIIMPNNKLADSTVKNFSQVSMETSAVVNCGVAYGSDLELVEKVALEVAEKIQKTAEGAKKDYHPILRYLEFADSNINFVVYLRAENKLSRAKVEHQFVKELKKRFEQENIEISWPVVKVVKD